MKYAPKKVYIRESGGYVELSYTDFCRRRQADQTYMDKLFIPIQGCLLEVVREQYTDFYRDKERWRYLQRLDTKNSLISLDGFTDSEGNPLDFIADEAMDVAEIVVNAVMVDRLKAALPLLSDSEWDERHREFNEVWDETLYRRALRVPKSLDERMIEEERNETLCKAIESLPEIQRRRFLLYYEHDFNFYQIAAMEHCTASAIQKSVAIAKEKVKAEMKKYLQP